MVKEKIAPQYFPLPKPIINYLCDSADYDSLRKLYKSCKYFYSKTRLSVINRLRIDETHVAEMHVLPMKIPKSIKLISISEKQLDLISFRLWITESLAIFHLTTITTLVSKIAKCDVKYLTITCKITYPELRVLAKAGTIEYLMFYPDNDFSYDDVIPLEDVFELIPKATSIAMTLCKVTKETMKKLLLLKHQTKIKKLILAKINEPLDAKLLDEFLKINLDNEAKAFRISFIDGQTRLMEEIVKNISSWTPEERKPENFPDIEALVD